MRKNVLITFAILGILIVVMGLFALVLLKQSQSTNNNQNGSSDIEIGKPTEPGVDNIGPQGPALLPTKQPAKVNEEK